jgi:spermidine synthase
VIRIAPHVLFFLSGVAALGYQLVWAKMFSTGLGHEMPAVLAIIAAFMAGMALGAAVLDRFIPRDARAGRWLCGLELVIGLWAVATSFLIPHLNEAALQFIGLNPSALRQWTVAFALPAIALLPATMAMGATFLAMEKFLSAHVRELCSISGVYAANTLGAVAGALLAPFVLMPALGFTKSCWLLATINVAVAFGVWWVNRKANHQPLRSSTSDQTRGQTSFNRLTLTLFLTGLLSLSYETAGVRVLSQVLEGTVFTYATVLAVFLLGTAAGAGAFHRWWRNRTPQRSLPILLYATGMACLLGLIALAGSGRIYRAGRQLGDTPLAVFVAEMLTASAVFALPAFLMGAVFSQLTQLARAASGSLGRVIAVNTLGAALAPAIVVALLPLAGAKWVLFATAFGYFLVNLPARPPALGIPFLLLFLLLAATGASIRLQWLIEVPPGHRIALHQEGVMASVAVVEDAATNRTLRVDNRYQMGGTAAADAEYRQAHLPMLLHPNPQRALFLGVGTGISFGAASLYPGLKADGIELVPEVVKAMPFFKAKNFSPDQQPDLNLHIADARRFVRVSEQSYDVIIADLFHPYRDGAGALYTREHFAAVREQLTADGLFCQWLPLHQLDEATLRVIVRTFQNVFPECEAWLLRFNVEVPVVALMGWSGSARWSPNQIDQRLKATSLSQELKRLAIADSLRLFGHLLVDSEDLSRFAAGAPLNTDDNQRVTFMAPRAAYQHDAKPYASLMALFASSKTERIVESRPHQPADAAFAAQLTRYLAARNVYLRGLIHDAEQRRDDAIDAYIESARLSPDFTTGYAQGLSIANVLAGSDPARAKRILERLVEAQPERPVARQMLERLFPK